MRKFALLALVLCATLASAAPENATKLMADARAQAKREGKNVMVVFHASWCGWCKKLDKMLESPEIKPIFAKSYVVVHLDVMESGAMKAQENPGGMEILKTLGGAEAGLPYLAVVAPDGKKIGDSWFKDGAKKSNTGHPATPNEIAAFLELVKKTGPKTDSKGREKIEAYLKADAAAQR